MSDHFHRVRASVTAYFDDVAPLPDGDDGRVTAEARWIDADCDGCGVVLVLRPLHGVIDQLHANELVIAFAGELTVDLDIGLVAVGPILVDDALVDVFVGSLDRAGVNVARLPERSLGVERLVEIACVATRVGKRQMEAMRRILREEAVTDRPDAVWNTGRFVEYKAHPVEVVHPCVRVRVLFRPQSPFD